LRTEFVFAKVLFDRSDAAEASLAGWLELFARLRLVVAENQHQNAHYRAVGRRHEPLLSRAVQHSAFCNAEAADVV
jgi:hypothetical protein